jgi:hypothetical protein
VKDGGPGSVSFFQGNKGASARWSDWNLDQSRKQPVDTCFDLVRSKAQTLIVIQYIDHDPVYRAILDRTLDEIKSLVPMNLDGQITWPSAYVFIASPGFYTPYHIDHEAGLLLQIRGSKDMYIYDPQDRSILSEEELEDYYTGNLSAAKLREGKEDRATRFRLQPGSAVQFPPHAPHWVKNGGEYSISLSINFDLLAYDRVAKVYQMNYFLRKAHLSPLSPGKSAWRDLVKRWIIQLLDKRHPRNKSEMLRSGFRRWYSIADYGRSALKFLRFGAQS